MFSIDGGYFIARMFDAVPSDFVLSELPLVSSVMVLQDGRIAGRIEGREITASDYTQRLERRPWHPQSADHL